MLFLSKIICGWKSFKR